MDTFFEILGIFLFIIGILIGVGLILLMIYIATLGWGTLLTILAELVLLFIFSAVARLYGVFA